MSKLLMTKIGYTLEDRRPANLHNGFDFVVGVENINFIPDGRRRSYPKHDDIIIDLTEKKKESSKKYIQLYSVLELVTCKHCNCIYRQSKTRQTPGLRFYEDDICPYCNNSNGSSLEYDFNNRK